MSAKLTNFDKIRRLPWLLAGGAFNTVFFTLSISGSVFVLFLNALGLDKTRIGFVLALLPFCGLLALLAAGFITRVGYKKVFLACWGTRKAVILLLLFTPLVLHTYGVDHAFFWVAGTLLLFGIFRAIGESAFYSWFQEAVPSYIRGRYFAIANTICTLTGILAMAIGAYLIGAFQGLGRFMVLIAIGVGAGIVSVTCYFLVPGGAPAKPGLQGLAKGKSVFHALSDGNFLKFCGGVGLINLAFTAMVSFVPLFMKEQVNLSDSNIVLLGIGTSGGVLLSCFLWGWAADRFGSKPVMSSGLCLMVLLPIFYFSIPHGGGNCFLLAMLINAFYGLANVGWEIGYSRYLFDSAVPTEHKSQYMALFYAWANVTAGAGPLLAGWLIDACRGLHWSGKLFIIDPYSPLFAGVFVLGIVGLLLISKVRSYGAMSLGTFAGMFVQGNPLMAFDSLIRYKFTADENDRVWVTERMGRARNPLTVVELIEALRDPSFNVRHEAIIAASRMPADPRLVQALIEVLTGSELDLSLHAAWALGNLRDKSAILPLRETLWSGYPLLQARSARALGMLGDTGIIPFLLERVKTETDQGLRIAYASALGLLRSSEATEQLLGLLAETPGQTPRGELALALARILGLESNYIRLVRNLRRDPATATAQTVLALRKDLARARGPDKEFAGLVRKCAHSFARDDAAAAVKLLSEIIRTLLTKPLAPPCVPILGECADRLDQFGPERREYILLALHAIYAALEHDRNG